MIREIGIRNFVLIEQLALQLHSGFNVLTGETGAGKSIIIDALSLLLGERARGDIIRPGADEARVEAVFDCFDRRSQARVREFLLEHGLEPDSEGLFVKRIIKRDGRGRCYINSSPTPLKVLERLGNFLVDIHGQHEHQSLLHGETYIELLDAYGGLESQAESVGEQFAQLQKIGREIERLEEAQRERRRQEDHLRFQIEEIEQAQIVPEEEDALEQQRRRLQHAGRLAENAQAIQSLLVEGADERPAILDGLAETQRRLQEMAEVDPQLADVERDLGVALVQLEEAGREIASYAQDIENDPGRMEQVEERLHLYSSLKRKYGATLDEVLEYLETAHQRLSEFEDVEKNLDRLAAERMETVRRYVEEARSLSQQRQKAAVKLSRAVTREMKALGMEHAQFLVQVEALGETGATLELEGKNYRASSRGLDRVQFLVNMNPGQEMRPLRQVASGGELSRLALAIKTVLARVDRVGCLVFDEIDAGVGGDTAEVVGAKFRRVAEDRQVICITHLPQIAGKAHRNFRVSKSTSKGQTQAGVEPIEGEALVREIARMLGDEDSKDSVAFARKLVQQEKN